jgi:DNA-binding transcriptional MocR family regulator
VLSSLAVQSLLDPNWKVKKPLYGSLAAALRSAVVTGEIASGQRLPSERSLAEALGVSRATVVATYELLRSDGLVVSRTGSGTFVVPRAAAGGSLRMHDMVESPLGDRRRLALALEPINFSLSRPRPLSDLMRLALAESGPMISGLAESIEYAPQGLPELRDEVAGSFTARGLPTTGDQIIITAGAQQAIGLVAELFVKSGDVVMFESPTYLGALDAIRGKGARQVAVQASAGLDIEQADKVARRARPALFFVMPTCHSITGRVMGVEERELLAALSLELQMPLIEDDIFAELTFDRDPAPPIAAYAEDAPIFTVGSTSKLLWNGLRVGWLRAPHAMVKRLCRLKGAADLGTSLVGQAVALQLIRRRQEVAGWRREEMHKCLDQASELLKGALPDWTWQRPEGGRSLWLGLPHGSAVAFVRAAARHGVTVFPGPVFSPDTANDDHLRMMYVHPERVLGEGILRLARAWSEYASNGG